MAFKESGVSEKFSDATKKFSQKNISEVQTVKDTYHSSEQKVNAKGRDVDLSSNERDTGYFNNSAIDNVLNDDPHIPQTNIPTSASVSPVQQNIQIVESMQKDDYEHPMQSNTLEEQTAPVTFSKDKHDSVFADEMLLRGSYQHFSRKEKPVNEEFVDRTSTFQKEKNGFDASRDEAYVYFDGKKSKSEKTQATSDGSIETPIKSHEKMAYRESFTNTAGGAKIESHYTQKGKLKSDITLASQKERTDNKGFRNRTIRFVDKTGKTLETFSTEDDEAIASMFDTKTEILLEHQIDRKNEKRGRYSKLEKEAKSERKELQREIKKDKKKHNDNIDHSFKSTVSVFKDEDTRFESAEKKFKKSRSNNDEASIFVESTATPAVAVAATTTNLNADIVVRTQTNQQTVSQGNVESNKFENGSIANNSNGNKNVRSVDSYFADDSDNAKGKTGTGVSQNRFMTKEEHLEQAKSKEKAAKKEKDKQLKKVAATTAVAKMLNAKKNVQNQLGDMSGQGTGDLMKDGSTGLLQTFVNGFKQGIAHAFKAIGNSLWKCVGSLLGSISVPILIFLVCVMLVVSVISSLGSAVSANSDSGVEYDLDVSGDGFVYENLTDEEIENIISALYSNYDDMTLEQEMVLRYALSKVGCAYDQAYHGNLNVDIFDCSSLAYRSYLQAGIDISNNGTYTAAEECLAMVNADKITDGEELKPGDLIFYGGSDNGRYLGIYHVAIYVGKIDGVDKMVEARGTSWGVVYCDVRTNNVVKTARPYE